MIGTRTYFLQNVASMFVAIGLLLFLPTHFASAAAFSDNGDGTITDASSSLMWEKCDFGKATTTCAGAASTFSFANASTTCKNLRLVSQSDWRIPQVAELDTIVDRTKQNPSINGTYFASTTIQWHWTNEPRVSTPANGWVVMFDEGSVSDDVKTVAYPIKCVRTLPLVVASSSATSTVQYFSLVSSPQLDLALILFALALGIWMATIFTTRTHV